MNIYVFTYLFVLNILRKYSSGKNYSSPVWSQVLELLVTAVLMLILLRCTVTWLTTVTLMCIHGREHTFVQKPWNLPVYAEFLCFRGMLQNSILAGDKGTNTAYL